MDEHGEFDPTVRGRPPAPEPRGRSVRPEQRTPGRAPRQEPAERRAPQKGAREPSGSPRGGAQRPVPVAPSTKPAAPTTQPKPASARGARPAAGAAGQGAARSAPPRPPSAPPAAPSTPPSTPPSDPRARPASSPPRAAAPEHRQAPASGADAPEADDVRARRRGRRPRRSVPTQPAETERTAPPPRVRATPGAPPAASARPTQPAARTASAPPRQAAPGRTTTPPTPAAPQTARATRHDAPAATAARARKGTPAGETARTQPPPRPAPAAAPSEFRSDSPSLAVPAEAPLVAPDSVASRSLGALIAIMTFLCALLWGGVMLVDQAADAWGGTVRGEITVTVLPDDQNPIAERLDAVAAILADTPALSAVRTVSAADGEALLEPWLGTGLDLSRLPVPRLVVATSDGTLDAAALAERLSSVPGVALDGHEEWSTRLSSMAGRVAGGTVAALVLMMLATALSVVFATRAAIASNNATVEVLHLLGADERFIARAFRARLWRIGLIGALLGAVVAAGLFALLGLWGMLVGGDEMAQTRAFFGDPNIGAGGFIGIGVIALMITLLTAAASNRAVRHFLRKQEMGR